MEVTVGSMVRVPLAGRRVRGFVVEVHDGEPDGLKELRAVSGDVPVFHARLLESLRWAAFHYVSPLAVVLARAAPPNLPHRGAQGVYPPVPPGPDAPGDSVAYLMAPDNWVEHLRDTLAPVVGAGRSALVVAPTGAETEAYGEQLAAVFGPRVMAVTPALSDRSITAMWVAGATSPGSIVVGTHRVAFWPIAELGLAVVIEEGRRGMKDRQTPTIHARDLSVPGRESRGSRFGSSVECPLPSCWEPAPG